MGIDNAQHCRLVVGMKRRCLERTDGEKEGLTTGFHA